MVISRVPGSVIGNPGGSLAGAHLTWARNANVAAAGQQGEQRTGRILNALAARPGGPTVLHDLAIPIPGISANIDHVVVSANAITLIDSKMWKPGFYWTLGRTFRGLQPFPFADKRTLPMAADAIRGYLTKRARTPFALTRSVMVIWPSGASKPLTLRACRPQSSVAVSGAAFAHRPHRYVGRASADPKIVAALSALVH